MTDHDESRAAAPLSFVAGATGFTGRAIAAQPAAVHGVELRLQVRPHSKSRAKLHADPRIYEVDLAEEDALVKAMEGCTSVMQLIGTVRARFDDDTSYETVDYGTTQQLLRAARRAGVGHFILLSSIGAGVGWGSYLSWKQKTENLVKQGGLPYSIVRPGYLAGDETFPDRSKAVLGQAFMTGLSDSPLGSPFADLRPINIQVLARLLLEMARRGPTRRVWKGRHLFETARELGLL